MLTTAAAVERGSDHPSAQAGRGPMTLPAPRHIEFILPSEPLDNVEIDSARQ
jgi:hypothetical protein